MADTKPRFPYARGWQFTREDRPDKPIYFALEDEYRTADEALQAYSRVAAEHFSIYFRTRDGKLHATADDSTPDDFDESDEICAEYLEYLMQIAFDVKKAFTYAKDRGVWFWHDRAVPCDLTGQAFDTFFSALQDATEPYLEQESE